MRRAMKKGNTLKTKIANGTFIAAVSFTLALIMGIIGVMTFFFQARFKSYWQDKNPNAYLFDGYEEIPSEYQGFLFINAPSSFKEFLAKEHAERFFRYGTAELDAQYDFISSGRLMRLHGTCAAIAFPKGSEDLLEKGESLEVLTYILTDRTEYYEANKYLENIIELYNNYLKEVNGYPQITVKSASVELNGINGANYQSSLFGLIGVVPLIIFILVLYAIMTAGTNVISGEKERGTFAAIVLTPVPRSSIVIGNVLGISLLAAIPSMIICVLTMVFSGRPDVIGLLVSFMLVCSFALLIASITILISIINQSVVSAQTAFLPIFLIILGIAVNSIQKLGIVEKYFLYFPLYGHFFGLGNAFASGHSYYPGYIGCAIICTAISVLMSVIVIAISTKLLYNEKFMTNEGGMSAKEIKKANKVKRELGIDVLIRHLTFPLFVLSFVQPLALIPTAISYMRNDVYSDFILSLKDVSGMMDIISTISEVLAMFLSSPLFLICMTLGYLLLIAIYCISIRIRENNPEPLKSMGFTGEHKARKYLIGLLTGFVLLTSVCLILIITGNLRFYGIGVDFSNITVILAGLPMWFVQGAAEEVMFRGYMIPRLKEKFGIVFAVFYSSFLFAILHGANIGFTILAGINLFIIAVFFALIYIYTESIWFTCAAHSAWNFCQGSLYGLEVSGSDSGVSIITSSYSKHAPALLTGGSFGPEGGLAVTIVTLIGIAIITVLLIKKKKKSVAANV